MSKYSEVEKILVSNQFTWLVTGCAGFIGSHLVDTLLNLNQIVIGIDNFSNGKEANIEMILNSKTNEIRENFTLIRDDVRNINMYTSILSSFDFVLHQAAVGSVPRSIKDPLNSHDSNVTGFAALLNFIINLPKKPRVVFASSSSVYGDNQDDQKTEEILGNLLSPYALTKRVNEQYAEVFSRVYGLSCVGLRYFNVFGPRQDPNGAYAAVIPKWIDAVINNKKIVIFGDGSTSRDFCFVENVVRANILAAMNGGSNQYNCLNIALNDSTSLNSLLEKIIKISNKDKKELNIHHENFRMGDIYKSRASIEKARSIISYEPAITLDEGLKITFDAFLGL